MRNEEFRKILFVDVERQRLLFKFNNADSPKEREIFSTELERHRHQGDILRQQLGVRMNNSQLDEYWQYIDSYIDELDDSILELATELLKKCSGNQ